MNDRSQHIVVVGAGAFGALVSYSLARKGCKVTLIDKDLPGRATSASAGGLWAVGESIGLEKDRPVLQVTYSQRRQSHCRKVR